MIKRIILEVDMFEDTFNDGENLFTYAVRMVQQSGFSGYCIMDLKPVVEMQRINDGYGNNYGIVTKQVLSIEIQMQDKV